MPDKLEDCLSQKDREGLVGYTVNQLIVEIRDREPCILATLTATTSKGKPDQLLFILAHIIKNSAVKGDTDGALDAIRQTLIRFKIEDELINKELGR